MTEIKSSGIPCKGNITGNYEKVPMELFDYLELGLITRTDFVIYLKLYQYYNEEYGYAFPTVLQIMLMTGVGGKDTIDKSIDRLVEVGLLEKAKGYKGNNIYRVYKPLERSELYKYVPDMVKELNAKKIKLGLQAEQEKARLQIWQQEQQEKEIEARQVVPQWV